MRIDIITVNGSPIGVTPLEIESRGVGGAELALLRLSEGLANRGHKVNVYNDPRQHYETGNLRFVYRHTFNPDDYRDIVISFRGPNDLALAAKAGKHIGFSCDQFTEGDYNRWYADVNKMVLISPFHADDHKIRYPGADQNKMIVTDLGVLRREYDIEADKDYNQFIFCSVPDRGLWRVADIWPTIVSKYPDAKLIITSDYRLWGVADPGNMEYRLRFASLPNVKFLGKVNRSELVVHQLRSAIHLYPCTYDELFNISTAETQSAGCYAITTNQGAVGTTNFTGKIARTNEDFFREIDNYMQMPVEEKMALQKLIKAKALARFDWDKIIDKWENEIL